MTDWSELTPEEKQEVKQVVKTIFRPIKWFVIALFLFPLVVLAGIAGIIALCAYLFG